MEDANLAAALRAELVARIGTERYEFWFSTQAQLSVADGQLVVRATSGFVRDWLQRNFAEALTSCTRALLGENATLNFEVESGDSEVHQLSPGGKKPVPSVANGNSPQSAIRNPKSEISTQRRSAQTASITDRPLRPAHSTLAQFAVGPSNEYAYRCAELTAHGRQQASPLLFCATTGLGKTHLLRAIQGEYRRRYPRATAVYLTAEQFTTSFLEALHGSGLPSFRQKCRGAELLLIDDLQFFINKARTIEELQHTVDTLVTAGKQLVFSSDRNLAALRALGPELVSRLSGGLVCEIDPPEFATRLVILQRLSIDLGLSIDDNLLSMVASQITAGPRELRGALYRLQAVHAATGRPLTRTSAEDALSDLVRQSTRSVRLPDVEQAVCNVFGVEAAQLRTQHKGRDKSEPRMLAMWLARKYTRAPWSEIGEFFGRRSHSTVISAHRRVEKLLTSQAKIGVGNEPCTVEEAIRRLEQALRTA